MAGNQQTWPICGSSGNYIDSGTLCLSLSPTPGPLGGRVPRLVNPLRLDLPSPPLAGQPPGPPTPHILPAPPAPARPPAPPQPQQAVLQALVDGMLEEAGVDLPASVDPLHPEVWELGRLTPLDDITESVVESLSPFILGIWGLAPPTHEAVRKAVEQFYQDKLKEKESEKVTVTFQMQYAPTLLFWAAPPPPSSWQNAWQLSAGATYRNHRYGGAGLEQSLQLQLAGSSFDVGSAHDWFQNLLLVYQAAYVAPLGRDFHILDQGGWSATLNILAQVAAGVGNPGEKELYFEWMVQPSIGTQFVLSLASLQFVVGGQVVGSFLSTSGPIPEPNSRPQGNVGLQPYIGVGLSF